MVKKMLTMIAISALITFEVVVLLVVTYPIKKLPPIDSLDFDTALGQDLSDLPDTHPSRFVMEIPSRCAGMVQEVSISLC